MNLHVKLAPEQQLTIREFLAFAAGRPKGERWELIEGVAVKNPAPVGLHQLVTANIVSSLLVHKSRTGATWIALLGIGTRVPASPRSLPQPDVYVQEGAVGGEPVTDDALVIFEVLSKSNTKADQAWRRKVYASVPNCRHYVTVSLKAADVAAFDRASGWKPRRIEGLSGRLELDALGVALPLADIYRWTPIGTPKPTRKPRR
jgi:Uma2 family endonuclease